MKKVFAIFLLFAILCFCCSCEKNVEKDVVRVRLFAENAKERDKLIAGINDLLDGADGEEECERRLFEAGHTATEEFFEGGRYAGRYFRPGYYVTFRIGEGETGWQYVAYPSCVYQSLEEYKDARYSSFFYEIVKKMEERNQNEKG